MDRSDVVIVGGVACGPKTGAVLARRLPGTRITLFQKEEHLSYATCGLPYFASGDVGALDQLMATSYGVKRDAEFFRITKGISVVTGAEVIAVDRESKIITARYLSTGETVQHAYGKLVLATGAVPRKPPFSVPRSERICSFTRPSDATAFRGLAEQGEIETALIVGGGFIGCEMAEATGGLWGIHATMIEKEAQVLPYVLDAEMAAMVERELDRHGTPVRTETNVRDTKLDIDGCPVVTLAGGESMTVDYVLLCLGVTPNVDLAASCGLDIGSTGGIVVNSRMQTSDPNIYAGGDCVESRHQITGQPMYLPMGSLANRQGRVIAENLAGSESRFSGVVGTSLVKVFDMNVGAVGLTEKAARDAGLRIDSVWGSFADKPDYYPESQTFVLKMVYERGSGRLLGLQAVGAGDICRRIDVFSSFLRSRATVDDLLDFEHGYAPPYAEALDPLHHLAAMAQAQGRGVVFLNPNDNQQVPGGDSVLLDVREPAEFADEPFPGSGNVINIPLGDLRRRADEIDRTKRVVVMCKRGPRAYQAALILKATGFDDLGVLAGGLQALI
ncbi:MAG: FAD-dependent oxidoreductase [Candidatus Zixiibacteriota bacterium]